jgi:flavin-dependent dehydrogenase
MPLAVSLEESVSDRTYDALVVGAGPAGGTAALLLARAGWSVAVMERKEFPRRKVCGEYLSATNLPLIDHLNLGQLFREEGSPPVTHAGLFAGAYIVTAPLPRPGSEPGRGLAREKLDTILLRRAAEAGACVWQPYTAVGLVRDGQEHRVRAEHLHTRAAVELRARVVVLAHGSWDVGELPSQRDRPPPRASDLLAFKTHYRGGSLQPGLMPLMALPGGYGGIAHCESERFSLSFCIRRDMLAAVRGRYPGVSAGEAVANHAQEHCRGVREGLVGAEQDGPWLAAGPIHPGIRLRIGHGVFPVGNYAGEPQPATAEGISIAMQSAWLLARRLIAWRDADGVWDDLSAVGVSYARAWRRWFAPRVRAGAVIAQWLVRPTPVAALMPLLRTFPQLLTLGARLTGKATGVVRERTTASCTKQWPTDPRSAAVFPFPLVRLSKALP